MISWRTQSHTSVCPINFLDCGSIMNISKQLKYFFLLLALAIVIVVVVALYFHQSPFAIDKQRPQHPTTSSEKEAHTPSKVNEVPIPQSAHTYPSQKAVIPSSEVDVYKIQQLANALIVGSVDNKVEAIKFLSKIGTSEQKELIERYARDTSQPIAIRLAAVESIDWNTNVKTITDILRSNNGLGEAAMYMAESKEMSPETRNIIDNTIASAFNQAANPSTQLAILDYLFEQHSDKFDELASQVITDTYRPDQKEDLERLLQKRNDEKTDISQ
jgi:hypothetical protein